MLLLWGILCGCGASPFTAPGPDSGGPDVAPPEDTAPPPEASRPDTGPAPVPPNPNPVVVGVVPDHGPFRGGNRVVVRGTNFAEESVVSFGGSMVQPRDTVLTDTRRLTVVPPSNRPGVVDVEVVVGERRAVLPRGYTYDAVYADPPDGSIAGGTYLTVQGLGTHFDDTTAVTLDGAPCRDVRVQGPERLTCVTAAHPEGRVTLAVATGEERHAVPDGFNYTDSADTIRGGLSGGAIIDSVNVTVIASGTGDALPGAYVFLGEDPAVPAPRSGRTDTRGRLTLSVPGLRGPATLTVSARCFNSHTIQVFDARNVTVYLSPQMIPACAMGDPPPSTPSRGTFAAQVSGELVWEGPMEFAPNPWNNIPRPRAGERRVAFVYATQPDIIYPTIAPGEGGTVLEVVTPGYGGRGYPFTIVARPAALAVYAIAGIENIRTQRFTPYIMGVARGVLGAPRATVTNVSVAMNIPLDHATDVTLEALPPPVRGEPNRVRVEGFIDLGGEGVIARPDISVVGRDELDTYRLVALPAFSGTLADARLTVRGIFGSNDQFNVTPYSVNIAAGITSPDDVVRLRNWVGIPNITSPMENGRLGDAREVRFTLAEGSPDMWWVTLAGDVLYWQTFALGTERAFRFPDLSAIMGLRDIPEGTPLYMNLSGLRVPAFNFNQFRYSYLSTLYWNAYSARTLLFTR
ncbi:MAG: IPT/TIG domain-containing protein [Deltaproteobacteria bacterium]|nr:IPT/TIG domain-containing protein [Deltaproteobacteria bacterium]